MNILSYGEDALTLAAFTHDLAGILRQLEDNSSPDEVIVLYRPSFGRRSSNDSNGRRSEFGEFDGIIVSDTSIYLVEAKWIASSEVQAGVLELRPEQRRRHEVFETYISLWRHHPSDSWTAFRAAAQTQFEAAVPGATIPAEGTTLAKNLEFVLKTVASRPRSVVNVILFSAPHSSLIAVPKTHANFRIVTFQVPAVGGAGYIPLIPASHFPGGTQRLTNV